MTSVTNRFFVGVAIAGCIVAGAANLAHAGVAVHGPYRWSASSWPRGTLLPFTAMTGYCWLSGFSVGSQASVPAGADQAYVFIDTSGNWQVSGANAAKPGKPPSSATWAEAYCVDGQAGGQSLFQPWAGYQAVACPPSNDDTYGGTCTSVNVSNSTVYSINPNVVPFTWTGNSNFKNNYWTNAFVHIQGVGYDGLSSQNQDQLTVQPPGLNGLYTDSELPVATYIQNKQSDVDVQVAYGAIWPFNDNKWFCAQGIAGQACTGVAVNVAAISSTQAGAANIRSSLGYVCALQYVQTSGASGPVTVRLTNANNDWNLSVAGPSFGGIRTTATTFCFPLPYATN